mmetsp:Transcript_39396/g.40134  ORF Transcript_39396/g.40134 Transcript_39396/m.40134 type:complete len:100 (-) Transcript_39396:505-804(-)
MLGKVIRIILISISYVGGVIGDIIALSPKDEVIIESDPTPNPIIHPIHPTDTKPPLSLSLSLTTSVFTPSVSRSVSILSSYSSFSLEGFVSSKRINRRP